MLRTSSTASRIVASGRVAAFGAASIVPSLVLSRTNVFAGLVVVAGLLAIALVLRALIGRFAPELSRGYVLARLCSPRFALRTLGLPYASGAAIAAYGAFGVAAVAALQLALAHRYRRRLQAPAAFRRALVMAAVGGLFFALDTLALRGNEWLLGARLLYAEESPLQRVVLVERERSLDFLIDGQLQFRSKDERLYHEGLVGPALRSLKGPARVLVLGGGDGLAARDLLACPHVSRVTIGDWDAAVTRLFRRNRELSALNRDALRDPRVTVVHRDVSELLADSPAEYDLIVGDLTDPNPDDPGSSELYAAEFYARARRRLSNDGLLVTHACSLDGAGSAAQVQEALQAAGLSTFAYSREVPSFELVTYVVGAVQAERLEAIASNVRELGARSAGTRRKGELTGQNVFAPPTSSKSW